MYEQGGIEALKQRDPYRPQSELEVHKLSIEQEFRKRPRGVQRNHEKTVDGGERH